MATAREDPFEKCIDHVEDVKRRDPRSSRVILSDQLVSFTVPKVHVARGVPLDAVKGVGEHGNEQIEEQNV